MRPGFDGTEIEPAHPEARFDPTDADILLERSDSIVRISQGLTADRSVDEAKWEIPDE